MTLGPGKYDTECTEMFHRLKADGVLLIVFGGHLGPGFSATLTEPILLKVPQVLRAIADQIDQGGGAA